MKLSPSTFLRPAVIAVCILVPPMVTNRGWWFVGRTGDGYSEPFEVFGMLVSLAILLYWAAAWRHRGPDRLERIVTRLVTGVIVLQFLYLMANYAGTSWDYRCYDAAARNVAKGLNPYNDTAYLYPPLLAQVLAGVHGVVTSTRIFYYENVSAWWLVFYFYQAIQLLLVFLLVELSFAYLRRLRVPLAWAAVLVAAAFLVSAPFFRTIRFQQTNLVVLAAILYSLARLRDRPLAAGALMAVAVMVKPQGIVFPLVWLFIGARRAVVGFVVAAAALVLVQAGFGADWTAWRQFVDSIAKIPKYNDFFRNQSLFSVFSTLFRTVGIRVENAALLLFVRACHVAILGWFVYRFIDRERRFRAAAPGIAAEARGRFDLLVRVGGHTVDVALLALLGAPIVWEHHYAIALPAVFWVAALGRGRVPFPALIALVLMFVPSTFDVWFFSYHRLAGVFLFVIAMSPARSIDLAVRSWKLPWWTPAPADSGKQA